MCPVFNAYRDIVRMLNFLSCCRKQKNDQAKEKHYEKYTLSSEKSRNEYLRQVFLLDFDGDSCVGGIISILTYLKYDIWMLFPVAYVKRKKLLVTQAFHLQL